MTKVEELEREYKQVQAETETAEDTGADATELKARQQRIHEELQKVRMETQKQLSEIDEKIAASEKTAKEAALKAKVIQAVMAQKDQNFQKVALVGTQRLKELL